jgi:hypothetical protein
LVLKVRLPGYEFPEVKPDVDTVSWKLTEPPAPTVLAEGLPRVKKVPEATIPEMDTLDPELLVTIRVVLSDEAPEAVLKTTGLGVTVKVLPPPPPPEQSELPKLRFTVMTAAASLLPAPGFTVMVPVYMPGLARTAALVLSMLTTRLCGEPEAVPVVSVDLIQFALMPTLYLEGMPSLVVSVTDWPRGPMLAA